MCCSAAPASKLVFIPATPKEESRNCPNLDSRDFGNSWLPTQTSDWDEVWSKLVALLKSFSMVCRIRPAHTGIGSNPDFFWSEVKLPIWLLALLSTITCVADVQMAHVRPFSTSTLQGLSNSIKNILRQGFFTSTIELWNCGSPIQVPTFGNANLILTLASKWGCDTLLAPKLSFCYMYMDLWNSKAFKFFAHHALFVLEFSILLLMCAALELLGSLLMCY